MKHPPYKLFWAAVLVGVITIILCSCGATPQVVQQPTFNTPQDSISFSQSQKARERAWKLQQKKAREYYRKHKQHLQ